MQVAARLALGEGGAQNLASTITRFSLSLSYPTRSGLELSSAVTWVRNTTHSSTGICAVSDTSALKVAAADSDPSRI